ncbi:hypothetical protein Y032_0365g3596 [Ancylostoma ceylanicum]|nr:hypothetical protein Y032_0365g3596 [Ancylostoma ceylanicum]
MGAAVPGPRLNHGAGCFREPLHVPQQKPRHDRNREKGAQLYLLVCSKIQIKAGMVQASNRWWEEITTKGMSQENLNIFHSNLGVSHYARMAWDSTQSFGCASYKCPNFINTVCHYNGGGVEGGQIYKMGPACRRCSTIGSSQCEGGLCVL